MKRSELFFIFILLPLDLAMILLSFYLSFHLRAVLEITPLSLDFGVFDYLKYGLYLIPVWVFLFASNGLYSGKRFQSLWEEFYRVFIASSTATLFLIVVIFLTKSLFFSRIILVFTWILSIALIFFGRLLWASIRFSLYRKGIGLRNILLIGRNDASEAIITEIEENPTSGYRVRGMLTDETNAEAKDTLGRVDDLGEVTRRYQITDVILTDINIGKRKMLEILRFCQDQKIAFKYIPDIYSIMTQSFRSGLIGTIPAMEAVTMPLDGWGRIIKRMMDILFSVLFIILLSPVLIIIALIIKITSKGPILYTHARIGRDEREFKFYKFRSMYREKCDWKEQGLWTTASDDKSRVTAFGRIIRKTNLDELPQLFNILKGDMSFVGPRPELPKLVEKFETEYPDYFRRHRVKSGLTGWAQVNGLKGDTSIMERVKYDVYYIENWSLWFDLLIIVKTIGLVLNEAISAKSEYRPRS